MTLVKALSMVFVNGRRYRPGETFYIPKGMKPGMAMQVLDTKNEVKPPRAKPKSKRNTDEPETFSELAKRDAEMLAGVVD